MEKNNNMGFKRGTKSRPLIIVANNKQSKIFQGSKKQHQKWLQESTFRRGIIHHVYEDRGGEDVSYFRATKK